MNTEGYIGRFIYTYFSAAQVGTDKTKHKEK